MFMKLKPTVTVAHNNINHSIVEPVVIPFDWTISSYDSVINCDTVPFLRGGSLASSSSTAVTTAGDTDTAREHSHAPDGSSDVPDTVVGIFRGTAAPRPPAAPLAQALPQAPAAAVSFDVILLTDCIFSVLLVPHLVRILRHFSGRGTTVYCCHEIRDAVGVLAVFVLFTCPHPPLMSIGRECSVRLGAGEALPGEACPVQQAAPGVPEPVHPTHSGQTAAVIERDHLYMNVYVCLHS